MPTTSVRRLISALSLSSGLVLWIWVRCAFGKLMNDKTSASDLSISAASFGTFVRS